MFSDEIEKACEIEWYIFHIAGFYKVDKLNSELIGCYGYGYDRYQNSTLPSGEDVKIKDLISKEKFNEKYEKCIETTKSFNKDLVEIYRDCKLRSEYGNIYNEMFELKKHNLLDLMRPIISAGEDMDVKMFEYCWKQEKPECTVKKCIKSRVFKSYPAIEDMLKPFISSIALKAIRNETVRNANELVSFLHIRDLCELFSCIVPRICYVGLLDYMTMSKEKITADMKKAGAI